MAPRTFPESMNSSNNTQPAQAATPRPCAGDRRGDRPDTEPRGGAGGDRSEGPALRRRARPGFRSTSLKWHCSFRASTVSSCGPTTRAMCGSSLRLKAWPTTSPRTGPSDQAARRACGSGARRRRVLGVGVSEFQQPPCSATFSGIALTPPLAGRHRTGFGTRDCAGRCCWRPSRWASPPRLTWTGWHATSALSGSCSMRPCTACWRSTSGARCCPARCHWRRGSRRPCCHRCRRRSCAIRAGVTLAWTIYFVAMTVISVALYVGSSTRTWSTFATVVSGPLVAVMFVLEFALRRRCFPPAIAPRSRRRWPDSAPDARPGRSLGAAARQPHG